MNSKEFEEHLQLKNFNDLEDQYQKAKEFFLNLKEKITCDEVSQRFPAFCFCNQEIRVKFPTIFIRIINNQISYSDLKNILAGQGNLCISVETNVVKIPTFEHVQSLAIHCLEISLSENEKLAEKIESILKQKNIMSERCVTSGHYLIPIEVDDSGYISIIKYNYS